MKCINDELIQKYIDGETTPQEAGRIEKHLTDCSQCAKKIEEQKAFADRIKRDIKNLDSQPIVIPGFVTPAIRKRKLNPKIKHYFYAVSAACVIFLIVMLFPKQREEREVRLIYGFDGDFDSNRPVSQQEMVIMMIDANGKFVECN